MQREGKRVLWSPTPSSDRFVVYGGSDIRLQSWQPQRRTAKAGSRSLAVLTDLPPFRSLAWSPHSQSDDLVAIGLATGRTLLLRLQDPASHQPASPTTVPYHSVSLNVRQQRPVTALAFSPSDPSLLAVGLDKARDYAVHIWDIERSVRILDARFDDPNSAGLDGTRQSPYRPALRAPDARQATSPAPDPKPFGQLGTSEAVASTTFLHTGSSTSAQLVVGYASRSVRTFDVRERPTPVGAATYGQVPSAATSTASGIYQTRAINGLCGDPFDGHRFASWDTEGIVKLWDSRRSSEAILTFSEVDAGLSPFPAAAGAAHVSSPSSRRSAGLLGIAFSPLRRGLLGSMETNSSSVRMWDILQGAESWGKDSATHGDRESPEDPFIPAILSSSHLTRPFSRPPTSFTFTGISLSYGSGSQSLCSVSREGQVEFLEHHDPIRTAWSAEGELASLSGHRMQIIDSGAPDRTTLEAGTRLLASAPPSSERPSIARLSSVLSGRSQDSMGARTPRPTLRRKRTSLQSEDIKTVTERLESLRDLDEADEMPNPIASDVSTVMRARVHLGYAADASRNVKLTSDKLADFWAWINSVSDAEAMNSRGRALVDKHDFSFAGALALLRGFPSVTATAPQPTRSQLSLSFNIAPTPSTSTPVASASSALSSLVAGEAAQAHDDIARKLRRTGNLGNPMAETQARDAAYQAATRQMIDFNGVCAYVKATSEKLLPRRRLALAMCGPDFASDDATAVVKMYDAAGHAERAAAWAVFNGDSEEAIKSLRRSKDERLKLLAPTLATYVAQLRSKSPGDPTFNELCNSLSADLHDPFLRSIFAFLGSGTFADILEEEAMPLRDRLGVALRFLRDEELVKYLERLAKSLVAQGDLEGVAVTGLTGLGFQLLQTYVDRTGDVQTAALAASYVHPGKVFDYRAERWILTYRSLLDVWKLYIPRARFDVARGNRMRATRALLASAGAQLEPYDMAPARLLIRCHYCNRTVAPMAAARAPVITHLRSNSQTNQTGLPSPTPLLGFGDTSSAGTPPNANAAGSGVGSGSGGGVGSATGQLRGTRLKTTTCPSCHKRFPRCSICLTSISVPDPTEDAEPPMAWSWCQRCRHGGHAVHLSDWFRTHTLCAVAGCDCTCASS